MTNASPDPRTVRFASFELDLTTGELRKSGLKVRLQEQPFQLLAALLEIPGAVVSREELHQKLWPGDANVEFDQNLNAAVKRLRETLDDSAIHPRFVETLPRRGYRFIYPIESPDLAPGWVSQKLDHRPSRDSQRTRTNLPAAFRRWLFVCVSLVVTAALVWALWPRKEPEDRPSTASDGIRSLVVLPLENLSGDPEQEYFSDGMTDALIGALSKIASLRVISRTSAMQYKATDKTLSEIARELDVDGVVEGAVLQSGERVRITAQLVDAATDSSLWSESYERDLHDILDLQGEVARTIARAINIRLTPQEEASLAGRPKVRRGIYEAYLRGRFALESPDIPPSLQFGFLLRTRTAQSARDGRGVTPVFPSRATSRSSSPILWHKIQNSATLFSRCGPSTTPAALELRFQPQQVYPMPGRKNRQKQ